LTTGRFTARGIHHYTVNFNYNPTVVDMIKTVPTCARTYEPATKMWMITTDYAAQLADDLRGAGCTVVGMAQNNDWAKTLLRTVGPERADQVVRALTRIIHPDNPDTGDAELQRQLNTARDEVIR
jgi:HepA-related protein (HARP)